jgi:hypothetical protein
VSCCHHALQGFDKLPGHLVAIVTPVLHAVHCSYSSSDSQFAESRREKDVCRHADTADAESATPWRIGGGSGWLSFVKACYDHDIALAVMINKLASDIAVNGADCRGPSDTFEVKAGATAEFRNAENSKARDPSNKNAFLRHDFCPREL